MCDVNMGQCSNDNANTTAVAADHSTTVTPMSTNILTNSHTASSSSNTTNENKTSEEQKNIKNVSNSCWASQNGDFDGLKLSHSNNVSHANDEIVKFNELNCDRKEQFQVILNENIEDSSIPPLETIAFVWKIDNFFGRFGPDSYVQSSFFSKTFYSKSGEVFQLELCPHGEDTYVRQYVSVFLLLLSTTLNTARVLFEIAIRNRNNFLLNQEQNLRIYSTGDSWGFRDFVTRQELFDSENGLLINDDLVLECKVNVLERSVPISDSETEGEEEEEEFQIEENEKFLENTVSETESHLTGTEFSEDFKQSQNGNFVEIPNDEEQTDLEEEDEEDEEELETEEEELEEEDDEEELESEEEDENISEYSEDEIEENSSVFNEEEENEESQEIDEE